MKQKFRLAEGEGCKRVMITHEDGKEGCIGEIFENTLVTKRDPDKHTMRRWNAYGVDRQLIDSELFDVVVFEEPTISWMIPVDDFKLYAQVWKGEEGEQYFIAKDKLTKL